MLNICCGFSNYYIYLSTHFYRTECCIYLIWIESKFSRVLKIKNVEKLWIFTWGFHYFSTSNILLDSNNFILYFNITTVPHCALFFLLFFSSNIFDNCGTRSCQPSLQGNTLSPIHCICNDFHTFPGWKITWVIRISKWRRVEMRRDYRLSD